MLTKLCGRRVPLFVAVCFVGPLGRAGQRSFGTSEPSGTVLGEKSRQPVEGVTVTLHDIGSGRVRSSTADADERYRFSLLTPGAYRVDAAGPSFPPISIDTINCPVVGSTPAASVPSPIAGHAGLAPEPLSFTAAYEPRQFPIGARVECR